jgi:excinuclease ABC subunit C
VIYIGKAASLKKRVASYFQTSRKKDTKTEMMVSQIAEIDFNVTANETEALLLEDNPIKHYQPFYNSLLKDDKSYPYLALTLKDEFPRLVITRNLKIPGARYYGPYTRARALRQTVDVLRKLFPLRTCYHSQPGRKSGSPCLYFEIGRCLAPCAGKTSSERYRQAVKELVEFLEGRGEKTLRKMENLMRQAAERQEYERAALYRDRLREARTLLEKQQVVSLSRENFDVIAVYKEGERGYLKVFFVRQGRLLGSRGYFFTDLAQSLDSLIVQFYLEHEAPGKIVLAEPLAEKEKIEETLSSLYSRKVKFIVPRGGAKKELLKMAEENAVYSFKIAALKGKTPAEFIKETLEELKRVLNLSRAPYRIECFDVSNLKGLEAVGSMVVFEDARPKRKDYRRFKIKEVAGANDYLMMKEVLQRRLKNLKEEKDKFQLEPDLILVDGGMPQLKAAKEALEELGLSIPFIALAKKEELVYRPGESSPLRLPRSSLALQLLQRIRDESHRFALSYHRQLRDKKFSRSFLENISGVGKKRASKLLEVFESAEGVSKASLDELKSVLPERVAEAVYEYFRS